MKKILLLAGLLVSFSSFPQTVGGVPGSSVDSSTNPSGQAFGGAMGGGPSAVPSNGSTTRGPTTTVPQSDTELGIPRGNQFPQQSMEEREGVSPGSQTTIPRTNSYPDTPVAPAVPPTGTGLPRSPNTTSPTSQQDRSGIGSGVVTP